MKSIIKISPRAYHLLRGPKSKGKDKHKFEIETFNIPLPHPRTLEKHFHCTYTNKCGPIASYILAFVKMCELKRGLQ